MVGSLKYSCVSYGLCCSGCDRSTPIPGRSCGVSFVYGIVPRFRYVVVIFLYDGSVYGELPLDISNCVSFCVSRLSTCLPGSASLVRQTLFP